MSRKFFALALGALLAGVLSSRAQADDIVVIQAGGQACGQESCGRGGCGRDHGCCNEGVCVPYTQTKKVEKRCYTDTCEQFCLPKCSCFGGLFGGGCGGGCGDGACGAGSCAADHQCGHVRTKKYLIVKIKQEEQCVPACKFEQGGCAAHGCAAPANTIQPVPARPMPAPKAASAGQSALPLQVLEYRDMPTTRK